MTRKCWVNISTALVFVVFVGSFFSKAALAFPGSDHPWIEPNAGEAQQQQQARSPCPGMNTAANHGFLSRSGRDLPLNEIAQVLEDLFSYNATESMRIFQLFRSLGLETGMNAKGQTTLLSLEDLYDERFLHDASLVHQDPGIVASEQGGGGGGYYSTTTSLELWEQLKAASTDGVVLTREDLLSHQIVRAKDSLENNPEASLQRLTSPYVRNFLAGEKMFLLLAGGHDTLQEITLDAAKDFLINNRLPTTEGYLPRQDRNLTVVDFKTDFTKEIRDYFFEGIQNGLLEEEEEEVEESSDSGGGGGGGGGSGSTENSQGGELQEQEEGLQSSSSSSSGGMTAWSLLLIFLATSAGIFLGR